MRSPLLSLTLLACATAVPALEQVAVGPRHLALGGAGTACAEGYTAQFYNPAALVGSGSSVTGCAPYGPQPQPQVWSLGLDVATGTRIGGDLVTYARELSAIEASRLRQLAASQAADPTAVMQVLSLAHGIGATDPRQDSVTADLNVGTGLRIGRFAIGVRNFSQVTAKVLYLDRVNLGLVPNGVNLVDWLNTAVNGRSRPAPTVNYTPVYFSQAQYDQIRSTLGQYTSNTNRIDLAAQDLDRLSIAAGLNPADSAATATALIGNGTPSAIGILDGARGRTRGLITSNLTTVRVSGLAVNELPLSISHEVTDQVALGVSVKPMQGRVYATDIRILGSQTDLSDTLEDVADNYTTSYSVGIDLGILVRLPYVALGLTGRNLNNPHFEGPTVLGFKHHDQTVYGTLTTGISVTPLQSVTIACDCDLVETPTSMPGYGIQRLGGGVEWTPFGFIAMRLGLSQNLAENDVGLMYHAGGRLTFWNVNCEGALSASEERTEYDSRTIPREARLSLALSAAW